MATISLEELVEQQRNILAMLEGILGGSTVTLGFLAKQQERILEDLAVLRDDFRVTAAIVQRLDATVPGLVNEVRAGHARDDSLARRLDRLEAEAPS